jgi:hypothetical protein
MNEPTPGQLEKLLREAVDDGDDDMVRLCRWAIDDGHPNALTACAKAIAAKEQGWWPTRDVNPYPKMTALAYSFPTLRDAPIDPFEASELEHWIMGPSAGSGATWAAIFVLSVFNPGAMPYRSCGLFDLHAALAVWDAEHRAAFLRWVKEPWWP